jgi:putative transposase
VLTPHSIYTQFGINDQARQLAYRGLFVYQMEDKLLQDIRKAANKGLALGHDHFFADIESFTGRRVIEGKRGRPVGWRKDKSDVKTLN